MSKTITTLTKARSLIARGWTQGSAAHDQHGNCVEPRDPRATCWCILGAIAATGAGDVRADDALRQTIGEDALANWNDQPFRTQAHVLKLFDDTIERLTKEAAQ